MGKILMLGSNGQIGTVLAGALRMKYGRDQIICSDIRQPISPEGIFLKLDVLDKDSIAKVIDDHGVDQIYHLAAILSASGEKNPLLTWQINMQGLLNVLELGVEKKIKKIFFPSSIAIYGPSTPKVRTPQFGSFMPTTVYGISKITGEMWCEYYHKRFGLDVRSIRYPGVIGWQSLPEGGTTDYAVEIFHGALKSKSYNCFLKENTRLPMIYMDDVIRATIELMEADGKRLRLRSGYNLVGMSFTPKEIAEEIKKHIPDFKIEYNPDFRQNIAESWTESINDQEAKDDWDWKPQYDLAAMTSDMLKMLKDKV
ncbi:MAG: NAD-dependent epimerase/dehydratase family protein [Saprospiraceae bacterium]|nr:NAD-dependent epimerase/dehydratase family protein [Saprospiraceae bacterium]MBK7811459.1 NAD-dependent epimerase/dehydratase family protein [Saprospiraceae bacterium]MBK9631284.1 NAD-dependent epimerase/dehydratase family protein [Saprospiraceae bacterium]